jgi:long-chain acyl-CoA synthetase
MSTYYDQRPWLSLYTDGVPADAEPEHASALAVWDRQVTERGREPFLYAFDDELSFARIDQDADALASALVEGGFSRGDRVAVYLQNDVAWVITLLATWKAGGAVVPLNPMYRSKELDYHLNDSGARVLVCLESLYRQCPAEVLERTPVDRVITTHPADYLEGEESRQRLARYVPEPKDVPDATEDLLELVEAHAGRRPPTIELTRDDIGLLPYTSGTTGPPKGAMNTHGNILHSSRVYRDWFSLGDGDVVLGVAPLFHITGLIGHITAAMYAGVPLILFHRFDAGETLRLIERWRATFTVGSITVFLALLDDPSIGDMDLSSLTKVASGGAPVSPAIVDRFENATGAYIHTVYGMTETTSPSHFTPLGVRGPVDEDTGALSVGVPVTGARSRIVDIETRETLPVGEVGEIVVEGPMVAAGYWQKDEETEKAMPGGAMHTGDVGKMDEHGWFYVVDRAKDQINAAGYKIWPREVEDVLYEHHAVREAAVIGVPDPYRGETVKAFVAVDTAAEVTADELIAFCRDRLAAYKYPRDLEIVDEIPKTPTGKFLRRELRDRES